MSESLMSSKTLSTLILTGMDLRKQQYEMIIIKGLNDNEQAIESGIKEPNH